MRGYLGDRSRTNLGISLVEEPANFAECNLSQLLTLLLGNPLKRDSLEGAVFLDPGFGGVNLLLVGGIDPGGEQAPGFFALGARVGEAKIGPLAQKQGFLLAEPTVRSGATALSHLA